MASSWDSECAQKCVWVSHCLAESVCNRDMISRGALIYRLATGSARIKGNMTLSAGETLSEHPAESSPVLMPCCQPERMADYRSPVSSERERGWWGVDHRALCSTTKGSLLVPAAAMTMPCVQQGPECRDCCRDIGLCGWGKAFARDILLHWALDAFAEVASPWQPLKHGSQVFHTSCCRAKSWALDKARVYSDFRFPAPASEPRSPSIVSSAFQTPSPLEGPGSPSTP